MVALTLKFERCALVAVAGILMSLLLGAAHIWRNVSDPAGELFNKREWSIVQALQQRSDAYPFTDTVITVPGAMESPEYDAIALPRSDKSGVVWILANAQGIPRVKLVSDAALRQICEEELDRIRAELRLNADVETLLQSLTRPDCDT